MLAVCFCLIMAAFRLWGRAGLWVWMAVSSIVSNIQVTKTVVLFGARATLGNIVYATGFLATDILCEFYGPRDAGRAVQVGFFSLVAMTVLMRGALLFAPAPEDLAHQALEGVFSMMPRIAAASLAAYLLSNAHDIWAYQFWRRHAGPLWVRNNLSTFASQTIDTLVFTLGAFWGVHRRGVLVGIILSTLLLKWAAAVCDTPFLYLARRWVRAGRIRDLEAAA